ncbi:MAG: glycosyltransferase family 2 protein [Caldilineaceae bacterium]|nr:glycosyltransferase family 2 protein [Caldilineaceae bacterium]
MSARLIAVILTKNEAHHVQECIASLRGWTDAVVVWDSGSTDGTQARARAAGALVVHRPFDDYARQRQAVLDSIAAEWILFVDADERATPALTAEIESAIRKRSERPQFAGFWLPRRNFIVGHEMRGGGYSPDYQLRLLRRDRAHYDLSREVHEIVELDGEAGYLRQPLIHYNYAAWDQFHEKQRRYAHYEAKILAGRGIRPRPHNFILQPLREFRRRFLILGGWRDGWPGLRLALLLAWYYGFVPYWELLTKRERVA